MKISDRLVKQANYTVKIVGKEDWLSGGHSLNTMIDSSSIYTLVFRVEKSDFTTTTIIHKQTRIRNLLYFIQKHRPQRGKIYSRSIRQFDMI